MSTIEEYCNQSVVEIERIQAIVNGGAMLSGHDILIARLFANHLEHVAKGIEAKIAEIRAAQAKAVSE